MSIAVQLAFQSVLSNWRHSIATLMSVSLGFMAVAAVHGYIADCEASFVQVYVYRSMKGHVIIEAEQSREDQIDIDGRTSDHILDVAKSMDNKIQSVVRFLDINGMIAGPKSSFRYMGYGFDVVQGEVTRGEKWIWHTPYGSPLNAGPASQILVGKGLAELLGCPMEGRSPKTLPDGRYLDYNEKLLCFKNMMQMTALTSSSKMNSWDAPIVGIVDATFRDLEDQWLMMPLNDAQTFADTKNVSSLGIVLKDPSKVYEFISEFKKNLGSQKIPLKITYWKDHESATVYRSLMGIMRVFEGFMLLIITFVCVLSIINTMARNVSQRVHEIGTLRAIGYRNSFITRMFAWEGLFLGLTGTIVGVIGMLICSFLLDRAGILYSPALVSQKVLLRIALTPDAFLYLGLVLAFCSAATAAIVTKIKIGKNIAELLQGHS